MLLHMLISFPIRKAFNEPMIVESFPITNVILPHGRIFSIIEIEFIILLLHKDPIQINNLKYIKDN